MGPEEREINPDMLNEQMSDTLLKIREQLGAMYLSRNVLTEDIAEDISRQIGKLEEIADRIGDKIKKEVLFTLRVKIDSLHTIGIVDEPRTFERQAGNFIDLLEMVLLCTDGTVQRNKGKILNLIEGERARDY